MNIVKRVVRAARHHMEEGGPARDYLLERGATPEQIETHRVGWFPEDEWPPYVDEGESDEADAYREWSAKGAKLKGRLVFPTETALGSLAGFMCRGWGEDARAYREFRGESAGPHEVFFGSSAAVEAAWRTGRAYVVEGPFDLFAVRRAFEPVFAALTARVTPDQARCLRRLVDEVYVIFDNDEQGRDGFEKFRDEHGVAFDKVERVRYKGADPAEAMARSDDFASDLRASIDPLGLN